MELLWVVLDVDNLDVTADGDYWDFSITLGSPPASPLNIGNPRVIIRGQEQYFSLTPPVKVTLPQRFNLQSKDGFGYLLAADTFNVNGISGGQAAAVAFSWRIYYRFVDVSIDEYVGIVQSQQQSS